MNIIQIILGSIFLLLGLIHFYWAAGGKWAIDTAIPTGVDGRKMLNPSTLATVLVGLILVFLSIFYFQNYIEIRHLAILNRVLPWLIPTLFGIRALGDFKYVGFFKTIKNTPFAKMDTRYFSPLCVLISLLGFLLYFR